MPSSTPSLSSVPAGAHYSVHISRVDNGWIVQHIDLDLDESEFVVAAINVHGDIKAPQQPEEYTQNASLRDALRVSFAGHLRTKNRGGLVFTNEATGYDHEPECVFYEVTKPIELPGITILPNSTPVDKNSNVIQITLRELQEALNANRKH